MINITSKSLGSAPLVSVAIVTYQQKRFLIEVVESVLAQDYPKVEIIVADAGSTDGSHEVLQGYADRFPDKFKLVLSTKNHDITINSNAALNACGGKYVAWLGSDELMCSKRLSTQVAILEDNPNVTFVFSKLDLLDAVSGRIFGSVPRVAKPCYSLKEGLAYIIGQSNPTPASSVTHRRSFAPISGFSPYIPCASDWFFWIKLCVNSGPMGRIAYANETLGSYRRHPAIITLREMPDEFLTLAMLEHKYPQYWRFINKGRTKLLYAKGSQNRINNPALALTQLTASIAYWKFSLKAWFRFMQVALFQVQRKMFT